VLAGDRLVADAMALVAGEPGTDIKSALNNRLLNANLVSVANAEMLSVR
jgi:hypothetical protein